MCVSVVSAVERERSGVGCSYWAESTAEKRAVGGGTRVTTGPPSATGATGLGPV